uniref:Uncharacterized protein n=1 Tax=Bubo bubo TaxID=30461 RepID=A0A8C0F4X5_BUBBB
DLCLSVHPPASCVVTGENSGLDAIRDYRTRKSEHTPDIGVASPAQRVPVTLATCGTWPCCPPYTSSLRPHYPGEIGWGVRELSHFTRKRLQSGVQIKVRKTLYMKLPELQKAERSCERTRENTAVRLKTVLYKTSGLQKLQEIFLQHIARSQAPRWMKLPEK